MRGKTLISKKGYGRGFTWGNYDGERKEICWLTLEGPREMYM
jgi:hypothetical protein